MARDLSKFTFLAQLQDQGRVLLGSSSCSPLILIEDVRSFQETYCQTRELGFADFCRVWKDAGFSLVHFAAPSDLGRSSFYHLLQSIFVHMFVPIQSDVLIATDNVLSTCQLNAFVIYSLYMLYHTVPKFLLPVPATFVTMNTFQVIMAFSSYIHNLWMHEAPEQDSRESIRSLLDVLVVTRALFSKEIIQVTAWEGGEVACSSQLSLKDNRWIKGVAGPDGWTQALALRRNHDEQEAQDSHPSITLRRNIKQSLLDTPISRLTSMTPNATLYADEYARLLQALPNAFANSRNTFTSSWFQQVFERLNDLQSRTKSLLATADSTDMNARTHPKQRFKRRRAEHIKPTVVLPSPGKPSSS